MQPKPVVLKDALKTYSHDQDKIISPENTLTKFKQRLAQTGLHILEDVVRVDKGRLDIPVYFSLCGPEARDTIGNVKQMGKGATAAQAQASAVMELGERFSLFSFKNNPGHFKTAPWKDLGEPAMDFDAIARSVQDDPKDLPIVRGLFEALPLQWTQAYNLTRRKTVWAPFNWFWTINEFNGSSAGNCNEEALCQGICEIVERHVSALICSQQRKVPLIDPASISDPVALELLAKYQSAGIDIYLSDFTCSMGIPTVGVLAWDASDFPRSSEIVWTAGTAPQPAKALCRALTEVAQLAGDFNTNANYVASGLPKFGRIEDAHYITHPGAGQDFRSLPDLNHENIKTEVERCIHALANRGYEIFTVDVHHALLDIPAFYTFAPGLMFRERAVAASVAMICAKIVVDTFSPDAALAWLTQMDESLPGKYFVHFYMGQIHLNQGRHDEAEHCLFAAAGFQPPHEDLASIYTYLGLCRKEMHKYEAALEVLQRAEKLDPERTDTLNLIGFCHFKLKNHLSAIDAFKKIVALNPSSAIDYANMAVNYRALGDRGKAVHYYQLALALDSDIDFARGHLVEMGVK